MDGQIADQLGGALRAVREQQPLVQCLTNIVVAQWTANVLLAVGATPVMVDNPHEAGPLAAVAGGVLVNLGTPYDDTVVAMHDAAQAADRAGRPWILDPVGAGALPWRTEIAQTLVDRHRPTVVRGNASEILALAGGRGGKGVDSVDSPEAARQAAGEIAAKHATVVAVSGSVDHITDGERLIRVANGDPLLTRVTGVGCALGALMAGFAAVLPDPLLAAVAATSVLTIAAELAAETSAGPGSFAVALLDALAAISAQDVVERVRVL